MRLHSTLDGRAGEFRLRGAAWQRDGRSFRGFVYLIPRRRADGRHEVAEAEGDDLWDLLDALGARVALLCGSNVERLNAHLVRPLESPRPASHRARSRERVLQTA